MRKGSQQKEKRKNLTPSGRLENVFSVGQLGLVQEETLVVFYTRMPRETARTMWNEVEINSHLEQAYSPIPKMKKQTDGKSLNSLKASSATKAKKSLSIAGKTKNIVV